MKSKIEFFVRQNKVEKTLISNKLTFFFVVLEMLVLVVSPSEIAEILSMACLSVLLLLYKKKSLNL